MEKNKIITIVGAGSWGTTLSVILARKGCRINLWTRSKATHDEIKNYRKNAKYTSDLYIPENVIPFINKEENFNNPEIIIFAVPSHVLRKIVLKFHKNLKENIENIRCILNVAKGLEIGSNLRLSQVMGQCLPGELVSKICVLSGPNIASEIARGLPSVSVVASHSKELLKYIQPVLSSDKFRVYTNRDVTGVEIGGAVKNIIAIAAGISDGLGYKANTKASLITRGLHELTKFGIKLGADPVTFSGAAGMGDLIATCISQNSRNRYVGERIAKGEKIDKILKSMFMVAEGVKTTKAVYNLSKKMDIEVPITECVYNIIYENLNPVESVKKLMNRKIKSEI
ncbi:MAG: glycerol-3-phosphate dehydrogenase [Actinobacteria bacterium RBG_19FT_COMBO_36_27]|nr:MAG: glycerol-3-phosphate dehydrogenase [Actinobacteria bacterium RBG_19FT_COMBO_36_27]